VWINDPENGQNNLRSSLNVAIWKAFAEHGIQIPYPRRDIRVLDLGNLTPPPTDTKQNNTPDKGL
jgi:small-conductance mechanosensitive channel